jgi:hypothetical protein
MLICELICFMFSEQNPNKLRALPENATICWLFQTINRILIKFNNRDMGSSEFMFAGYQKPLQFTL